MDPLGRGAPAVVVGAVLALLRTGIEPEHGSDGARPRRWWLPPPRATALRASSPRWPPRAASTSSSPSPTTRSPSIRDDLELAVVLVVVGLAVTEIALWGRRQQAARHAPGGLHPGLTHLLDLPPDTSERARADSHLAAITRTLGADRSEWVAGHPPMNDAVVDADGQVRTMGGRSPCGAGGPAHRRRAPPSPVPAAARRSATSASTASTHVVRPTRSSCRVAVLLADRMADDDRRPATEEEMGDVAHARGALDRHRRRPERNHEQPRAPSHVGQGLAKKSRTAVGSRRSQSTCDRSQAMSAVWPSTPPGVSHDDGRPAARTTSARPRRRCGRSRSSCAGRRRSRTRRASRWRARGRCAR